jgi:hypothetical protein
MAILEASRRILNIHCVKNFAFANVKNFKYIIKLCVITTSGRKQKHAVVLNGIPYKIKVNGTQRFITMFTGTCHWSLS